MYARSTGDFEFNLLVAGSHNTDLDINDGYELRKLLDAKHVTMIATGAAMGRGLSIDMGSVLRTTGPVSILIAYNTIGFLVYMVMCGLGEIATNAPFACGSRTVKYWVLKERRIQEYGLRSS